MKHSKNIIIGLVTVIILVVSVLIIQIIEAEKYIKENKILIEEKITEYGNGYRDGMLESIDTYNYIELLIKYGEAKERIKWLEKQPYYIEAPNNDFANDINKAAFSSEMVEKLLKLYGAKEDSLVLDNFMGTGTTTIGCQKIGCSSVGIELDTLTYKFSKERIKEFLGLFEDLDEINLFNI